MEPVEHVEEVVPSLRMVDVDIDLLARERRPQQEGRSVPRLVLREWEAWTGPVEGEEIRLLRAVREDPRVGQEHSGIPRASIVNGVLGLIEQSR